MRTDKGVEMSEESAVNILRSALDRLRNNTQYIFDKKTVRDWAETLAEADLALASTAKVGQPKVGELPPLDAKYMEHDPWEARKCRERQLLAEQQVSAGLREENAVLTRKGQDLCATLGNMGIHIHELGLRNDGETGEWKYRNARAEAAEASLAAVKSKHANLITLAKQVQSCQGIMSQDQFIKEVIKQLSTS